MYVVYHSSDAFANVTGVSITSLFENNKDMHSIHVLYIDHGVKEDNKQKLISIATKYNRSIEFVPVPNWSKRLKIDLKSCKRNWLGFGYNRLFLTELVPKDVNRVLYLDSDTIIGGSLQALWDTDLEGYYMAGVDDCLSAKYRKIVGLTKNGVYVNAGMLLINVQQWREDEVIKRFISKLIASNGFNIFNEQSLINSEFEGKIKVLPQEYNVNTLVATFEYKELLRLRQPYQFSYKPVEFYAAKKQPLLIHYTGNFYIKRRPWIQNSDHPYHNFYDKYRQITPWNDEPYLNDSRGMKDRLFTSISHLLPKSITVFLASILYNHIRPMVFLKQLRKMRAL